MTRRLSDKRATMIAMMLVMFASLIGGVVLGLLEVFALP